MGFYLQRNREASWLRAVQRRIGDGFVAFAPRLMKALTVIGTAAMFLVGGGILSHGVHAISEFSHSIASAAASVPVVGSVLESVVPSIADGLVGVVAGALVLLLVLAVKRVLPRRAQS
jgi:predicted DNA repair protein MutK